MDHTLSHPNPNTHSFIMQAQINSKKMPACSDIIKLELTMHCVRILFGDPPGVCFQRLVACHHWPKLRPCHTHLLNQQTRVARIIWKLQRTKHIIVRSSLQSMLLCALRRILTPSLAAARHHIASPGPQPLYHVIRSLESPIVRSMASSTYISPPVTAIDDDRQSEDVEAQLAPLRKAVQEQVRLE
jgi:hypothetical protein